MSLLPFLKIIKNLPYDFFGCRSISSKFVAVESAFFYCIFRVNNIKKYIYKKIIWSFKINNIQ
jgi:hypothetical protein